MSRRHLFQIEIPIGVRQWAVPALWCKHTYAVHDRDRLMAIQISAEGKLGLLLALVGIGGGGALFVFPHPYADYVGWSLIGISIVGLVLLGVYHVSSVFEEPPRPKLRSRKTDMTAPDAGFMAATASALIAVIAALARYNKIAGLAALIACLAVVFDFADRHKWIGVEILSSSSQMKLLPIQIRDREGDTVKFNSYYLNIGTIPAIGMHWQSKVAVEDRQLTTAEIDTIFEYLKATAKVEDTRADTETQPGDISWVTLPYILSHKINICR